MKRVLIPEDGRKAGLVAGEGRTKLGHIGLLVAAALLTAVRADAAGPPETVHVTYHVQSGKLDEFLATLGEHYPAGRKLGIVLAEPHIVLAGREDPPQPASTACEDPVLPTTSGPPPFSSNDDLIAVDAESGPLSSCNLTPTSFPDGQEVRGLTLGDYSFVREGQSIRAIPQRWLTRSTGRSRSWSRSSPPPR